MRLLILTTICLLLSQSAYAAEEGYYIGPEDGVDLRLAPRTNAAISDHFDHKQQVKILKRDRNWIKVQTVDYTGIRGWVPAGAVRKSSGPQPTRSAASAFFSSFTSMFRTSNTEQKTAVLGVRGLDSGDGSTTDIKAGKKALKIVDWMDTLNVPEGEVTAFIKEGDLKP